MLYSDKLISEKEVICDQFCGRFVYLVSPSFWLLALGSRVSDT